MATVFEFNNIQFEHLTPLGGMDFETYLKQLKPFKYSDVNTLMRDASITKEQLEFLMDPSEEETHVDGYA